jgi:hypothetical protein
VQPVHETPEFPSGEEQKCPRLDADVQAVYGQPGQHYAQWSGLTEKFRDCRRIEHKKYRLSQWMRGNILRGCEIVFETATETNRQWI